jgi:hypothetical protein
MGAWWPMPVTQNVSLLSTASDPKAPAFHHVGSMAHSQALEQKQKGCPSAERLSVGGITPH